MCVCGVCVRVCVCVCVYVCACEERGGGAGLLSLLLFLSVLRYNRSLGVDRNTCVRVSVFMELS